MCVGRDSGRRLHVARPPDGRFRREPGDDASPDFTLATRALDSLGYRPGHGRGDLDAPVLVTVSGVNGMAAAEFGAGP
jgi:hypothetical protein